MPRIRLAHWYGEHKPGDAIDVTDEQAKALSRDGLVAGVVTAAAPAPAETPVKTPPPATPAP